MIGFKNNNPGNIRYNPKIRGVIGRSKNGFAIFANRWSGLAAMRRLLLNYLRKGNNTITKIINRYAPASDGNQPLKYIGFIVNKTGILPNDLLKPEDLEKIIPAMVQMEHGKKLTPGDMFLSKHLDKIPFVGAALVLLLFRKLH
jgi:hypothetical protein